LPNALEGGGKSKVIHRAFVEVAYEMVSGMESLPGIAAEGGEDFLKKKTNLRDL